MRASCSEGGDRVDKVRADASRPYRYAGRLLTRRAAAVAATGPPDLADAFPSVPDHALGRDFFRSPARSRVAGVVALVLASVILLGTAITPALRAWEARGKSKEFTFMASHAGDPVRWNPCEAIHYVVNLGAAPAGSRRTCRTPCCG